MLIRKCAGVMAFHKGQVLLLQNEKHEWVFPFGVIRGEADPGVVALESLRQAAGIDAVILAEQGETSFEFFSISRHRPVRNMIRWFLLDIPTEKKPMLQIPEDSPHTEISFFPMEEAMELITYSQDKNMLMQAYQRLMRFQDDKH